MADRDEFLNDPETSFRLALGGLQSTIWTALPAYVLSVDFEEMTVSVQPTIQGIIYKEDGTKEYVNLPPLIHVPICFPKAGGFILTMPIKENDEVLVVFSSRCIDAWWQSGGIQKPMEIRMHDLSDGFAIPGPCSVPNVIPNISSTGAQLRNKAGTTYVEISDDGKIKLVSPSEIGVTGNLKVSGSIMAVGDVTAGPVSLLTHAHSGVTTGGGSSGPPV